MLLIQALISFIIIVLSVFISALVLRDARQSLQARLLAILSLSIAAGFVWMLPEIFAMPQWLRGVFRILSIPSMGLMWSFIRSLLDDEYRLNAFEYAVIALVSVFPALYCAQAFSVDIPWLTNISAYGSIPPFAAITYLAWSILRNYRDDLVEPRRYFRLWAVGFVLASAVLSLLSEELQNAQATELVRSFAILPSVVLLAFWLLRFQTNQLLFRKNAPTNGASLVESPSEATEAEQVVAVERLARKQGALQIDPKDQAAYGRLCQLMAEQHVYLQPELSIDGLARLLQIPEHQLRSLINQGLGYRNFSSYLNEARIQHAKKLFTDPNLARKQVLSIAMDSGFASLASFNRAFKGLVGITPTEFRNEQLQSQMHQK